MYLFSPSAQLSKQILAFLPIGKENLKNGATTTDVFGDELHRYSIADGIRDKNVLGFDLTQVLTFKEREIRRVVALEQIHAKSEDEFDEMPDDDENTIKTKKKKAERFYYFMNEVPMANPNPDDGKKVGIEDYITDAQYNNDVHRKAVVEDIIENFPTISRGSKFHAIFATSSISEAIRYYELFCALAPDMLLVAKIAWNFEPRLIVGKFSIISSTTAFR